MSSRARERQEFRERFIRLQKLVKAARKGDLSEVRELCKAGVSINSIAGTVTPLHAAVAHDRVECAKFLLENGASANQIIPDQVTPLHVASRFDNLASVLVLANHGADVNAVNGEGWTSLHLAARNGNTKCVEVLISVGAELNAYLRPSQASPRGKLTPLHFAARHGHVECIEMLLKFAADVNIQSGSTKSSALHMAVSQKHLHCVLLLILYGAAINAQNCAGDSPLHLAARGGSEEIVELLLQAGVDLTLVNNVRKSAAQIGDKTIRGHLESLSRNPRSLVFLSILAIRKSFHCGPMVDLVSTLPLPWILKEKLLLRNSVKFI